MLRSLLVLCAGIVALNGHIINRNKIKELDDKVKLYQEQQDKIYDKMEQLETDITMKINALGSQGTLGVSHTCPEGTVSTCVNKEAGQVDLVNMETRLGELEEQLDEILKYLTKEKEADTVLKTKSSEVIKTMKNKVQETDSVIVKLQETVDKSLDNFKTKIDKVNQSAQVTINSKGVIFYGRVGSPCSYDDECRTENSDCRSRRCQCNPGLSFDMETRKCVEACTDYGETYQSVDNYIIRGYNNLTLSDVQSFEECTEECSTNANFTCVTIDYFPRWKKCFLSEFTKLDVPEAAFEYNSVGVHYQRDCA